jgi:hypothetical protein
MTLEEKSTKGISRLFTEDWLAVVAGLALVALGLAGILKHIP